MGVDVEGLAVALSVEAHAQLQMDDQIRRAREATSGRLFWRALGIEGAQRQPRPLPHHRRRPGGAGR